MKLFSKLLSLGLGIGIISISLCLSSDILAGELQEIQKRGKLIVGIKDNLEPMGFVDARGELQGFEIELAKRLAQELLGDEQAIIFKPVTNLDRLDVVMEDKVDLVIARVTATSSRSRIVSLSTYYYLDGTGLVTNNPVLTNLTDLNRGKIAVLRNSSTIGVLKSQLPQAQLIGVESYQEAFTLLEAQGADAFAADNSILAGWVRQYPQYRQLPVRLSGEALCVVMPKGLQYESLRHQINQAITRWRREGWLQERATYWGLP